MSLSFADHWRACPGCGKPHGAGSRITGRAVRCGECELVSVWRRASEAEDAWTLSRPTDIFCRKSGLPLRAMTDDDAGPFPKIEIATSAPEEVIRL